MSRKTITVCLAIVIVFQMTVLAGEYLGAAYPLWTGEEIRLKVIPVDPRSLFRGNYARLRYDISSIESKGFGEKHPRIGEFVYIKLKPGADGLYSFNGAGLERPGSGPFIRGRLETQYWSSGSGKLNLRYGIEAYFAPRKKALALEKELGNGGIAVVMVASNGRATLKDVVANEKQ